MKEWQAREEGQGAAIIFWESDRRCGFAADRFEADPRTGIRNSSRPSISDYLLRRQ